MNEPKTIVKIKLHKDHVEYDVFLGRIGLDRYPLGMDVTANWQSIDIKSKTPGVFYTDANAFKIIKRDVFATKTYMIVGAQNNIK